MSRGAHEPAGPSERRPAGARPDGASDGEARAGTEARAGGAGGHPAHPTREAGAAASSSGARAAPAIELDDLPDGVLVVSRDGIIRAANAGFYDLTRRQPAEVVGQSLESLVAEEDVLRIVGFQAVFAPRATRDNTVIFNLPEGGRLPLIVSSLVARDGGHVTLSAHPLGTVQEALADASRWAAAEQTRSLDLLEAHDALAAKNEALSAARAELEAAYETLQRESSAREHLENELRLAQRLESIGQLAAGIAHEINTPMQYIGDNIFFLSSAFRSISVYLEAVLGALADSRAAEWPAARPELVRSLRKLRMSFLVEEVPKALAASRDGIQHVSRIVQAMNSLAHQDPDEKSYGDINRVLEQTLTVAQNELERLAVIETSFADLPPVLCYPGKLHQAFLNLLVNAAQAIEDARKPGPGLVRVSSSLSAGCVEVRISDDGCGVPEAVRHRVFDQFFTTKEAGRGSGQGLSIARNIFVDVHHGSIRFETAEGEGTTFIVTLPLGDGAAAA